MLGKATAVNINEKDFAAGTSLEDVRKIEPERDGAVLVFGPETTPKYEEKYCCRCSMSCHACRAG
jgi:hypothetical protein